jgi:hypothetical protein
MAEDSSVYLPEHESEQDVPDTRTRSAIASKLTKRVAESGSDTGTAPVSTKAATSKRKKRRTTKPKDVPDLTASPTPKAASGLKAASSNSVGALPDLGISLSQATGNTERWLQSIQGNAPLEVKIQVLPTLAKSPIAPIFNFPVYKNRNFIVKNIHKTNASRKLPGAGLETLSRIDFWHIDVQDTNHQPPTIITLFPPFPIMPHARLRVSNAAVGGVLDAALCKSKEAASRVGEEACRILNRIPKDFPHQTFVEGSEYGLRYPGFRLFAEVLALNALHPNFNHGTLFEPISSSTSESNARHYNGLHGPTISARGEVDTFFRFCYFDTDQLKPVLVKRRITNSSYDELRPVPAIPDYFHFHGRVSSKGKAPSKFLGDLMHWIQYETFLLVGTKHQVDTYVEDLLSPYNKRDRGSRSGQGSYGGSSLAYIQLKGNAVQIAPSDKVRESITGKIPSIMVTTNSKLFAAFVANQMLDTWLKQVSILHTWQAGVVAADMVNARLIDGQTILLTYCQCEDEQERTENVHICQSCWKERACIRMLLTVDGRLLCSACVVGKERSEDNLSSSRKLVRRIYHSLYTCVRSDVTLGGKGTVDRNTLKALRDKIDTQIDEAKSAFFDAYSMKYRIVDGSQETHNKSSLRRSPLTPSIEAVHPMYKKGALVQYHHPDNVVLVPLAINFAKGMSPVSLIPILKASLHLKEIEADEGWAQINNALDHVYLAKLCIPSKRLTRHRFFQRITNKQYDAIVSMCKSGIYDESLADIDSSRPNSRTIWQIPPPQPWSSRRIKEIDHIIRQIEARYAVKFDRVNGAPFFWNPEHIFSTYTWQLLERIMYSRFRTMDKWCDANREHHDESPDTLTLEVAVQIAERKGPKDLFFGFSLTILARHDAAMSIGRADLVKPGSKIQSGWIVKYPTSLDQYDRSRTTIAIESWLTNRYKSNFHGTADDMPVLREIIRDLSPESNCYPAAQISKLPSVNTRICKQLLDWSLKATKAAEALSNTENEGEEDVDDEDEKAFFMNETVVDLDNDSIQPIVEESKEDFGKQVDEASDDLATEDDDPGIGPSSVGQTSMTAKGKNKAVFEPAGVEGSDSLQNQFNEHFAFMKDIGQNHIPEHLQPRFYEAMQYFSNAALDLIVAKGEEATEYVEKTAEEK